MAEVKAEVAKAVEEFESPKDWALDAPFDHVYGTKHPYIEERRADVTSQVQRPCGDGRGRDRCLAATSTRKGCCLS